MKSSQHKGFLGSARYAARMQVANAEDAKALHEQRQAEARRKANEQIEARRKADEEKQAAGARQFAEYQQSLARLQQAMALLSDQKEEAPIAAGAIGNLSGMKSALKTNCQELIEAVEVVKDENIVLSTQILNQTAELIKNPHAVDLQEYGNLYEQARLISRSNGTTCEGPWGKVGISILGLLAIAGIVALCVVLSLSTLGTVLIAGTLIGLLVGALCLADDEPSFSRVTVNKDPKNVPAKMDSCKRSAFALFKDVDVKQGAQSKSMQPTSGPIPLAKAGM